MTTGKAISFEYLKFRGRLNIAAILTDKVVR